LLDHKRKHRRDINALTSGH